MLVTRLDNLSNEDLRIQKLMLENATQNQWKNVYRPKDQEIEALGQAMAASRRSMYGL